MGTAGLSVKYELTVVSSCRITDGVADANRFQPGKRPRSSDDRLFLLRMPVLAVAPVHRVIGYVAGHHRASMGYGLHRPQRCPMRSTVRSLY